MTKGDLRTGMWIETRNGQKWIVLLGTQDGDIVVHNEVKGGFNYLKLYDDDLLSKGYSCDYDIMKVFQPEPSCYLSLPFESCIFDRDKLSNTINVKLNAKIENLKEIKEQIEDLEESLQNLKIKLQL